MGLTFGGLIKLFYKMKVYYTYFISNCVEVLRNIFSSGVTSFSKVEGHKLGLPIWLISRCSPSHHLMAFIKDPVIHVVGNITIIIYVIHF